MKASFVIATYNRADDLERCVDSLLNQRDCECEILVVDDASSDRTREMVREKYGDRVRLVAREQNRGSVKNRNYGARLAGGDVLFLIDDDTEFPGQDTVREIMTEFKNPLVGAVAIPYMQDGVLHHDEPCANGARFVRASYVGCACAVRRSTFLSLGGYEEFFHHQVEEDDFCIRMLHEGQCCLVGRVSLPMKHYESPKRNFFNWDYYGRRNSILFVWKNCPLIYLVPNLLLTTLRGIQHAFRMRRFRGNLWGIICGYAAIVKSIAGKGCERAPVRKEVYDVTIRLRKNALPFERISSLMPGSGQ